MYESTRQDDGYSYFVFESLRKTRGKLHGRSIRIVALDEHFGVLRPRRLTGRVPLRRPYGRHFVRYDFELT